MSDCKNVRSVDGKPQKHFVCFLSKHRIQISFQEIYLNIATKHALRIKAFVLKHCTCMMKEKSLRCSEFTIVEASKSCHVVDVHTVDVRSSKLQD